MQELTVRDGQFAEVDGQMMEEMTRRGWSLVMVLPCTTIIDQREEVREMPCSWDSRQIERRTVRVPEYGNGHKYLVHCTENETRAALNREIAGLNDANRNLENDARKYTKEREELKASIERSEAALTKVRAMLDSAEKREQAARESARKYERHLGMIREAIGTQRLGEILAEGVAK